MPRSRTISVTPNLLKCFKVIRNAVKSMPEGELKKNARLAVNYFDRTFKGEPQPRKLWSCPRDAPRIG